MEFLPKKNQARFRAVSIAISAFFLLDLALLGTTFLLSDQVKENAIVINLAGRQRMLSQRMVKCLLQLERSQDDLARQASRQELELTYRLFDTTLQSFTHGGTTTGTEGLLQKVRQVSQPRARQLLTEAETLWSPYRSAIADLLADQRIDNAKLSTAVNLALQHNPELLNLMNQLTGNLEANAVNKTKEVHFLQTLMLSMALLSFLMVMLLMKSELKRANKQRETLDKIIDTINAGILILDEHDKVHAANQPAAQLFGYQDREAMLGLARTHLLFEWDKQLLGRRKNSVTFYAAMQTADFPLEDSQLKIVTISDISQQRSVEASLNKLAYYDALTGLPNRLLFEDRLHQGIFACKRQGSKLAVLFVDLDKFKEVNDNFGHHIGDLLLKEIAVRLRNHLREEDTVSRLGGDEFVILLNSISCIADCEKIVRNLLTALRAPFATDVVTLYQEASIGICIYPDHAQDEETIVNKADQAMYLAKRDSQRHYAFFSEIDTANA
jgi:diguanylate cyclase (GGDEF)-like protein